MKIEEIGIKITKDSKYLEWLKECYIYSKKSNHPSTHNAALLIKNNKIVLSGVNVLPPGVKEKKRTF